MKALPILLVALVGAAGAAAWQWQTADHLRTENETLRFQKKSLEDQVKALTEVRGDQQSGDVARLKAELAKAEPLKEEVLKLRARAAAADKVLVENERLRGENKQLHNAQSATPAAAAAPTDEPKPVDKFSKETWTFAGYTTPENSLISSLWAMREGKPQAYLDSLTPEEQARMAQRWANMSEADIAAKHQSDISTITGMRVLSSQDISPTEKQMSVFIEGPNRTETVSMKQVGNDWKFGGFVRNQGK